MKSRTTRSVPAAARILPLVDVFVLALLGLLLRNPLLDTAQQRLPRLADAEQEATELTDVATGRRLLLDLAGQVWWNGQSLAPMEAAQAVARETKPGETVPFVIEVEDGMGAFETGLELFAALTKHDVADRLRAVGLSRTDAGDPPTAAGGRS